MAETQQTDTSVIFISYRRTDAGWPADHLADKLGTLFGKHRVFLDVRSVEAGEDFSEEIATYLDRAAILVVLIGKNWLFAQDEFGRRRLDRKNDWVRREVRTALARKDCMVIPVLLDDAELPTKPRALPKDISALLQLQSSRLRQDSSEHDIDRLIDGIEKSGFKRLAHTADRPGTGTPLSKEGTQIALRKSPWTRSASGSAAVDVAQRLNHLIKGGKLLLDEQRNRPPSSPEQLDEASRQWHKWRQYSEQSMIEFFASPEPLHWLQELRPRHLDFNKPWEARKKELPKDIEKELNYFQNLLARLENYDEETSEKS